MKKAAIGIVAVAAIIGTPVLAADMAVKVPPTPVAAPPSWTGAYIGLNGGYGWSASSQINFTANDPLSAILLSAPVVPPAVRLQGGFGGFQVGYNWQISSKWLVGAETDFQFSSIDGTGTTANFINAPSLTATVTADQHVQWFGTLRARLGFLPTDNLLIYGTGGLSYGRIDENINVGFAGATGPIIIGVGPFDAPCIAGGANCFIGTSSRTATGWTAGAGAEYVISSHVTVKAEYLYVNLGGGDSFNVVSQNPPPGTLPSTFRATWGAVDFQTVRAGLNYRF
jgi:outer membrane immunogenic protein